MCVDDVLLFIRLNFDEHCMHTGSTILSIEFKVVYDSRAVAT